MLSSDNTICSQACSCQDVCDIMEHCTDMGSIESW